jgi:hypothetical protein
MECGAGKIIIKNIDIIIHKFIDSIKYATSRTNLLSKLNKILCRNLTYNIFGELGSDAGKKSMFLRIIFSRQKYYANQPKIRVKNNNIIIITYIYDQYRIIQTLYLENFKINYFSEEVVKKISKKRVQKERQKGGQGYSVMIGETPIAGKPVIRSYYDCCRPIFSGGKADSGYYLDVGGNHLVVQPQYRAY